MTTPRAVYVIFKSFIPRIYRYKQILMHIGSYTISIHLFRLWHFFNVRNEKKIFFHFSLDFMCVNVGFSLHVQKKFCVAFAHCWLSLISVTAWYTSLFFFFFCAIRGNIQKKREKFSRAFFEKKKKLSKISSRFHHDGAKKAKKKKNRKKCECECTQDSSWNCQFWHSKTWSEKEKKEQVLCEKEN